MSNKKLRVFEAFAGIGAQHSALERANLNYEIVGISEWFINALYAYDAIHNDDAKPKIAIPIHYGSVVGTKQDATDFIKLLYPTTKGIILMK